MLPAEYAVMAGVEDDHWWYRGLRRLVVEALERWGQQPLLDIVDAGCGTGGCAVAVRRRFPDARYVGLDVEPRALEFCRRRGLRELIRASVNGVPLRPHAADAVLCLDVLYFASIDMPAAVRQLSEVLRPGGLLVVNLPAFNVLRGRHDRSVGIPRRFRCGEVRALVEAAGLTARKATCWNAALFLPMVGWRWMSRVRNGVAPASDLIRLPRWLNRLVGALVQCEIRLIRRVSLPVGSSVFVVAQKAGSP